MVCVTRVANPKRAATASYDRYEHWVVGRTVAECIAAGMLGADVKWDTDKGFVTLASPDSPEGREAREAYLRSQG